MTSTQKYALALSRPWQFTPEAYGARGNGKVINAAAMTSGQNTLTTGTLSAPSAPSVSNSGSGGTILAGVYQVKITYHNAYGETVASSSASTTTSGSTSTITITSPASSNTATGWYAYVTQAGGSTYTRQQTAGQPSALGINLVLTAPPTSSGANPPGANTTQATPFTSGDVGKVIVVNGAGATLGGTSTPSALSTTITGFNSSSSVTLAANAGTTVSWQYATYGNDDTTAINSAVTAAVAYAQANNYFAEIMFQPAIYMIAGALTQGGPNLANAQIPLPLVPVGGNPTLTLKFTGTRCNSGSPMFQDQSATDDPGPANDGTVLKSTLTGQVTSGTFGQPSVIGSSPWQQGLTGGFTALWNNLKPVIDGITVMVPAIPSLSGFDFGTCVQAEVPWARAMADATVTEMQSNGHYPGWTGGQSVPVGLVMPQGGNAAHCLIGSYACSGFDTGCLFYEHSTFTEVFTQFCHFGMRVNGAAAGHGVVGVKYSCEHNFSHITVTDNPIGLEITQMMAENINEWGLAGGHFIEDGGGLAYGRIGMQTSLTPADVTINGGWNLEIILGYSANSTEGRGPKAGPTPPGSGTAQPNTFWRHAYVILSASGGSITQIAVGIIGSAGTGLGTTSGPVLVPSGSAITVTYTGTLSWTWYLI